MRLDPLAYLTAELDSLKAQGLYRHLRVLEGEQRASTTVDHRAVVNLSSNNYLGLTTHPKVREAATEAIQKYGTSMTGSRLVNGSMRLHNQLEEKLAAWHGKEAALVFTTGYQVNIATLAALLSNKKCVAVIDRNDHASIYDGVRLGQANGARMARYKHGDPASLDRVLSELGEGEGALVVTDGVFSAEGEIAKLPAIVEVVKRHKARLFVDDERLWAIVVSEEAVAFSLATPQAPSPTLAGSSLVGGAPLLVVAPAPAHAPAAVAA